MGIRSIGPPSQVAIDGSKSLPVIVKDQPIDVVVTNEAEGTIVVNIYDESLSVPSSTEVTIVSYTVPIGKIFKFDLATASGDNISKVKVNINGSTEAMKRTWWTSFNADFDLNGLYLEAGDVVEIKVEHFNATMNSDYEARISGREANA